eukprot:3532214-Pleurochrysis_carterae.AAC.1
MQEATRHSATLITLEYSTLISTKPQGLWGSFTPKLNSDYYHRNPPCGGKFVRHAAIGRAQVALYNVQIFCAKDEADKEVMLISLASLQELANKCSEYALPSPIPPPHSQASADASASEGSRGKKRRGGRGRAGGCGRGRGKGRGSTRQRTRDPDSSDEHELRDREEEEEEEDGGGGEEEDPPPPVPLGKQLVSWDSDAASFSEFLLWFCVAGGHACWHVGRVERVLQSGRRNGFTHNARLDGARSVRGVTLTKEGNIDGVWCPTAHLQAGLFV